MKNLKAITDAVISDAQGFFAVGEARVQKIIKKLSQGASVFYGNVDNEGMTVLIVDCDITPLEPFIGRLDWRNTDINTYDIYDVIGDARIRGEIGKNQMSDLFACVDRLGDCDCATLLVFSVNTRSEYVIADVAVEKVKRNSWKHGTIARSLAIGHVGIPSTKDIKENTSNY